MNIPIDQRKSVLIIIGAISIAENISVEMEGVLSDMANIEAIFASEIIGFDAENIHRLFDKNREEVIDEIALILKSGNWENIFLYYTGIGLVVGENSSRTLELSLSAAHTSERTEGKERTKTLTKAVFSEGSAEENFKISIAELSGLFLNQHSNANLIVFLDCGHSELAFKSFSNRNVFVIAAADQDSFTREYREGGAVSNTIIEIITSGIDNGKEVITLHQLYLELRERITNNPKYNFEPKMLSTNLTGYLDIALNQFSFPGKYLDSPFQIDSQTTKNILELISENKLDEAIDELNMLSANNFNLKQKIVRIKATRTILKDEESKGIISSESREIRQNKILNSLIDLVSSLTQGNNPS